MYNDNKTILIDDLFMKLVPITQEEIRKLKGFERAEAIRTYHKWLDRQRKQDKKEMKRLRQKLFYFKCRKENKCVACGGYNKKDTLRCEPCNKKHAEYVRKRNERDKRINKP